MTTMIPAPRSSAVGLARRHRRVGLWAATGAAVMLSAAFAAMCELAQLRPMLAFTPGHALVVIDVSAPLTDAPDEPGAPLIYDRYDGVLRIDYPSEWPPHLIAVDVACAA